MPAIGSAYRSGNLPLVQRIEHLLKLRLEVAQTGKAKIAAIVGRTNINRELLCQVSKLFTAVQAVNQLQRLLLNLLLLGVTINLKQNMRGAALLYQIGDAVLIGRLQFFLGDADF